MASQQTIDELASLAAQVRDEHRAGANTAQRVGGLLLRIVRALSTDDIEELSRYFLRKDVADIAQGIITFAQGLVANGTITASQGATFGRFIESITEGSGAAIDAQGHAEVETLKVRSYAMFMELIINRLNAVEGDTVFTDSGTIESVSEIEPGTYLLTMRKRWDYDFTAFQDNDVVFGSLNSLLADGSYRTSWFRVNSVNRSANQLTVSMYPDDEVPAGVNFPPEVSMTVSRRGNQANEERQSCWYISSYEGVIMYLEGVTKPILDESNYYLSVGRPKHLSLFNGLPINYSHPYLFARGAIIQDLLRIDFHGNPTYEVIDLGLYDPTAQYIRGYDSNLGRYVQHQVWYKSCCWRCMAEAATVGLPPRWNNTQWVCIVGDSNFTLEITSTRGRFFRYGQEYTQLGFILKHGEMDISVDASQVEWTRESGQAAEDTLWNIEHAIASATLDITPQDMPSNWFDTKQVSFRCTVSIRDGEEIQTYSETLDINR